MTALSDLHASASLAGTIVVGAGGGASAAYPVLSITERVAPDGPEGANGQPLTRRTLTVRSWAIASGESPAQVGALKETVRAALARRGEKVTIVEAGGAARVIRAGGDVSGISGAGAASPAGWPRVGVEFDADKSVGCHQFFTVTVESLEVSFDAQDLAAHQWSTAVTEDGSGLLRTSVRGEVRLKPGQDAAAWIAANVLDPARAAATGDGLMFGSRVITPTNDASLAQYEHDTAPAAFGAPGSGAVTVITETDSVRATPEGRRVRTVSGTVRGPDAYATAASRRPTPTPGTDLITAERISQPSTPDGAVGYEYELTMGTVDGRMVGTVFFGFRQTLSVQPGGRRALSAVYDSAAPIIFYGPAAPWTVIERTEYEFTGSAPTDADLPRAYDAQYLASFPAVEAEAQAPGWRRGSHTRVYVFDEEPAPASPAELVPA